MRTSIAATGLALLILCPIAKAIESSELLDGMNTKGGLVVVLGCGELELLTGLRGTDGYVVQGLDTDTARVKRARQAIRAKQLSGPVSTRSFDGRHLPYASNLVNLLVVADAFSVGREELLRVLCPGGSAIFLQAANGDSQPFTAGHRKLTKPWPDEIDEWTHYLHGPDNNAVTEDTTVGPPQHFQWISEPRFSRSHDHLASVSAMVSSAGRLFSIVDFGSIAFAGSQARWRLVAQDAFNGIRLWDREVSCWEYHLRDFRSGPADIARRLVAVGDRVFVTLGYGEPVVCLDAATGETVRSYAGTEGTREILCSGGRLLLVAGEPDTHWPAEEAKQIVSQEGYHPPFERISAPPHNLRVMAVDAESGKLLWERADVETKSLMPSTLATDKQRVYFQNTEAVICLDAASGTTLWRAPRAIQRRRLAWSTPTLVVHDGIVYSADRRSADTAGELLWMPSGGYHDYIRGDEVDGELIAYRAETGERLWSCPCYEGFNAPVDVLIADDLLWTGRYAWGNDPGITAARDLKTGEIRRQRPADQEFVSRMGHARCHRAKATSEFLVLGRRGIEFVDLETGDMVANFWVRGICQYGVMPANGLVYAPPHSCACSISDMLKCGFTALAPEDVGFSLPAVIKPQREKGPAYDALLAPSADLTSADGWPTYRGDVSRSGATSEAIPVELTSAWSTELGGRLSAPVAANGYVLVADVDGHTVFALDQATGQIVWSFTTGGRVNSPPSVYAGRVLFGSADGWVYCLRLSDGQLAWRFHAAPADRQIVVDGQLESAWPVSGNVLVLEGQAYFVAGRTSYLDGGMWFYKLDAATGRVLKSVKLDVDKEKRDAGVASGGYLPDILSSDRESIFLRSARFDRDLVRLKDTVPHLWSSVGFLDDNWWHRTYWQFGTFMNSGWGGWAKAGQQVPAGRILVTDGAMIFGYGRNQYDTPGAHVGVDADGVWGPIGRTQGRWTYYQVFGQPLTTTATARSRRAATDESDPRAWRRQCPVLGTALLLAGDTLFIAGPADPVTEIPHEPSRSDPLAEALRSDKGGALLAVSAADGSIRADCRLTSPPVFDGMAAMSGHLFMSTKDGHLVCLGPAQ